MVWNWAWSEATWEHKAFQYWAPKGMLAVPLNTYRYDYYYDDEGRYHYNYDWVNKLMIVNVTEDSLEIHGEVDHSRFYETERKSLVVILQHQEVYFHGRLHLPRFPMLALL